MTTTPAEIVKRLRDDADNIGHSNREIYPVASLLDAADLIERLQAERDAAHNAAIEMAAELFDDMAKINGSVRVSPKDAAESIRALAVPAQKEREVEATPPARED